MPAAIQLGFALLFLIAALALRDQIENGIFDGSAALYWILVIGVLAYAGSYFARGWLAGHKRFALYGGAGLPGVDLALSVRAGGRGGNRLRPGVVGLGMAVAPFASLCVIPFAFTRIRVQGFANVPAARRRGRGPGHGRSSRRPRTDLSLQHGAGFAVAVVGIMLAEQTLMNAGVLIVAANAGGAPA